MENKQNFDDLYTDMPVDPFDAPIPGESLTSDPDDRKPWEQPPKYTDVNVALQETFLMLTEGDAYEELMDMIRQGIPLDELTQLVLFKGYSGGMWNTDMMLIMAEPVLYMLIALAENSGIFDYVVYDGEEDDMEEEEAAQFISDDADRMMPKRSKVSEFINKSKKVEDVLPDSLLTQIQNTPSTSGEK